MHCEYSLKGKYRHLFFINSWRECEVFFKTSKDNSKVFVHSVVKCFTNIDN